MRSRKKNNKSGRYYSSGQLLRNTSIIQPNFEMGDLKNSLEIDFKSQAKIYKSFFLSCHFCNDSNYLGVIKIFFDTFF